MPESGRSLFCGRSEQVEAMPEMAAAFERQRDIDIEAAIRNAPELRGGY